MDFELDDIMDGDFEKPLDNYDTNDEDDDDDEYFEDDIFSDLFLSDWLIREDLNNSMVS